MIAGVSLQSQYRLGDILANAITHGVGAALALAGAVVLIVRAARGSAWLIVSCSIYAATLVLVYLCSTLYHSLVRTRARHVFHVLDHSAIYLLIAGTYTPFMLVSMRGPTGWTLLGVVWGLAVAGVVFKSLALGKFPAASATVYIMMGWCIIFGVRPLLHAHHMAGNDVAGRGRSGVYAGDCVFCQRPAALLPRAVAFIRTGWQRGALLRGAAVRGLAAAVSAGRMGAELLAGDVSLK